jgi:peptidoglycan/LPS O-acetylase OafA/YrhL
MAEITTAKQRFAFINALRGVGALSVVFFHASEGGHIPSVVASLPGWLTTIMQHGGAVIAIFFAISGFVIAHSVYSHRVTLSFALGFVVRRSVRLDPAYWVAIVVVIMFATLSAMIIPGKVAPDFTFAQILAHVLYLQDMLGFTQINSVFWTLCLEMQFYIVYIALLFVARNDPSKALQGAPTIILLLVAGLVALLWPIGVFHDGPWKGSFLPYWHCFLAGVGAYWAWKNPKITPYYLAMVTTLLVATAWRGDAFSFLCAASALIIWVVTASERSFPFFSWRWVQFLGAISYSLYLIHNPVTGATFRVGYMITGYSPSWEVFWWVNSIIASVACATVLWWFVEMPSIRLAKKMSAKLQQTSINPSGVTFNTYPAVANDGAAEGALKKI